MSLRQLRNASPWRGAASSPPLSLDNKLRAEESDEEEELFTVPDLEAAPPPSSSSNSKAASTTTVTQQSSGGGRDRDGAGGSAKLRRGRNPQDREYRRIKRLLRNRVSAQQARERKKVYVNELESGAKELEDKNASLEEKISTLINENTMLRKVLMNMRPKVDESSELQNDHSDKS